MLLESRRSSHSEASSSAAIHDVPHDSSQPGLEAALEAAVEAGIHAGMELIDTGVGAGESAMESLLSTNPDPDHVTHVSTIQAEPDGTESYLNGHASSPQHSSTPSEDSNKENSLELVNTVHTSASPRNPPSATGKRAALQLKPVSSSEVRVDLTEEEEQAEEGQESQGLLSQHQQRSDGAAPHTDKVRVWAVTEGLGTHAAASALHYTGAACNPLWILLSSTVLLSCLVQVTHKH